MVSGSGQLQGTDTEFQQDQAAMTWNSSSTNGTTSSKSSELFHLDEEDKSQILVYKYRSGCKNLEVTTQKELCKALDSGMFPTPHPRHPLLHTEIKRPPITNPLSSPPDPNLPFLRVTKKPIPRGNSRLEVRTEDLLMPEDLKRYSSKPTLKSSLANVGLPSSAYWKRLLFNAFPDLYIVSRSHTPTPDSSPNHSPESSQHVSPNTTFPVDTPHPPTSNGQA